MNTVNFLPLNEIFINEITSITAADLPPDNVYITPDTRQKLNTIEKIINDIGNLASKTQGCRRTVTTLDNLRRFPNQKLYVLKDALADHGNGQAIGFLKIAPKQLYLYDKVQNLKIATAICIMDFFVIEDRQRAGCGRLLFDFMLQDTKLNGYELALDGPSSKLLQFLKKHYGFDEVLKQRNNFVVCQKFFDNMEAICIKTAQYEVAHSPPHRSHRFSTEIASIIHGESSSSGTK